MAYSAATVLMEFDLHYQIDKPGSPAETPA
jgi:hypothetical protein